MEWTVAIGVNTHKDVHVAVAVDRVGAQLDSREVETTENGYRSLLSWALELGVPAFAVEGCGSYGAGLVRFLELAGVAVWECERGRRRERRRVAARRAERTRAVVPSSLLGPPDPSFYCVVWVGGLSQRAELVFVRAHHEAGHGGIEGVLRPGRSLEEIGGLVGKAGAQVRVSLGPAALPHRSGERAGIDLHHTRPPICGERPDLDIVLRQRQQVWHAANGAGAHGAGSSDLKDRLRSHAGVAIRSPV
jgi:Transposase